MKIEKETLIGKSFPKLDAAERATGRAVYIQDLKLPRMLHAAILRSDRVHAKIVSIDTRPYPGTQQHNQDQKNRQDQDRRSPATKQPVHAR